MKKRNKKIRNLVITIIFLIALVAVFYIAASVITNLMSKPSGNTTSIEDFAKCLTSKEAKMYGAYWCGHCQNQKSMFGDSVTYITYVECDPNGENPQSDLCLERGIQGYPTWEINGNLYPGEQSLAKLAELSGCELK